MIRPIDTVSMSESAKAEHIISELRNASLFSSSLVILDDLDLLMNYVRLGNVINYSEKLYHTIVTLIGHAPSKTTFLVLATCSNPEFVEFIESQFDAVHVLEEMTSEEASKVSAHLGLGPNSEAKTIRQLLTI